MTKASVEDLQGTLEQRARVLTSPHSAPEPGVAGFRQLWMSGSVVFFFTRKQLLFGWFELVEIHAFVFKRGPLETLVNSCGIFIHVSISTAVEFCPSIVAHEGGETLKTEGREIYV